MALCSLAWRGVMGVPIRLVSLNAVLYGLLWSYMAFYGLVPQFVVLNGILWSYMTFFYGPIWHFMVLHVILWSFTAEYVFSRSYRSKFI